LRGGAVKGEDDRAKREQAMGMAWVSPQRD
jgi:hypothetical protein